MVMVLGYEHLPRLWSKQMSLDSRLWVVLRSRLSEMLSGGGEMIDYEAKAKRICPHCRPWPDGHKRKGCRYCVEIAAFGRECAAQARKEIIDLIPDAFEDLKEELRKK